LYRCQLNGQSRNKLTGKSAVLGLFVFFYGVPQYTPVFPFGWSELRQKYILPYKPLLSCIVVPYSIIVVWSVFPIGGDMLYQQTDLLIA